MEQERQGFEGVEVLRQMGPWLCSIAAGEEESEDKGEGDFSPSGGGVGFAEVHIVTSFKAARKEGNTR